MATDHLSEGDIDEVDEDEPVVLDNVETIPAVILDYIRAAHPQYEKRTSRTVGSAYYMNVCNCGAHFGDFYLHSEPGGAFFPEDDEQAGQITIQQRPFSGTFEFECGYGIGTGSFIFQHAKRVKKP